MYVLEGVHKGLHLDSAILGAGAMAILCILAYVSAAFSVCVWVHACAVQLALVADS